jgi:hypothetical protein
VTGPLRGARQALPWLLLAYAAASLLHFAHNAEHLAEYPNLPSSWSRADVYIAWACVTVVGIVGYAVYRRGRPGTGLTLLCVYAALGFGGLLHYTRAPLAHHSPMMNATIWLEVAAAALLLLALAAIAGGADGSNAREDGGRLP